MFLHCSKNNTWPSLFRCFILNCVRNLWAFILDLLANDEDVQPYELMSQTFCKKLRKHKIPQNNIMIMG